MNKHKGSNAERELLHMFFSHGWVAIRTAGSGSTQEIACDLIAGKRDKKYGIEVKSTKKTTIYITKQQINDLIILTEIFGLTPVIALRFNYEGWLFMDPKDLRDSGKNWAVSIKEAKEKGHKFGQFF